MQTLSSVVRRNTKMKYFILAGSEPMQQSIRPFVGIEPTYTKEDFLNAIKLSLLMTAGPEQVDSPYNESWSLKQVAMLQTALIGRAQQWYSHSTLEN